jgi:hypothetical protein
VLRAPRHRFEGGMLEGFCNLEQMDVRYGIEMRVFLIFFYFEYRASSQMC